MDNHTLIDFFYEVNHLKRIMRTIWQRTGVDITESLASHQFRSSLISYIISLLEGKDAELTLINSLFYNLSKTRIGEVDVFSKRYHEDYHQFKREASREQIALLSPTLRGLIDESIANKKCAVLGRDSDFIETILQAHEYELRGNTSCSTLIQQIKINVQSVTAKKLIHTLNVTSPNDWYHNTLGTIHHSYKSFSTEQKILNFFFEIGMLKHITHSAERLVYTDKPNFTAEHCYRTAVIGVILADMLHVDPKKVASMCIFHDIHECRTGNFGLLQKRYFPTQVRAEKAIQSTIGNLPPDIGEQIYDLWFEYNFQKTAEATVAKDAGRLELALQYIEYINCGQKSAYSLLHEISKLIVTQEIRQLLQEAQQISPTNWWNNIVNSTPLDKKQKVKPVPVHTSLQDFVTTDTEH